MTGSPSDDAPHVPRERLAPDGDVGSPALFVTRLFWQRANNFGRQIVNDKASLPLATN